MNSDWLVIQVKVCIEVADLSPITSALMEAGCASTLESDDEWSVTGSLVASDEAMRMLQALVPTLEGMGAVDVLIDREEHQDWAEIWKRHYKPIAVGERFIIVPSWQEAPSSDRIELRLDPGQAFGTGEHPTTRLCMQLLETLTVDGERWLDIGTGTGVLAIALEKLGCGEVVATDIEPLAVEIAEDNCRLNDVEATFVTGDGIEELGPGDQQFDGVVSNIISATLLRLCPEVFSVVRPGGTWVVSGILKPNFAEIRLKAAQTGFVLETVLEEDDWIAAKFRKLEA